MPAGDLGRLALASATERETTRGAQHDCGASQRNGDALGHHREAEVAEPGIEDADAVGRLFGHEVGNRQGLEVEHREQLGNIDVLGRESAAQHVVGAGHDFDAEATEIGVDVARRQKQRLTGIQGHHVEQERNRDAGISGIVVGQQPHNAPVLAIASRR